MVVGGELLFPLRYVPECVVCEEWVSWDRSTNPAAVFGTCTLFIFHVGCYMLASDVAQVPLRERFLYVVI